MTVQEVVFLHVRTELTYEALCSTIAARPPATANTVLMGQNLDLDPTFRPFGMLIRRRPTDGPDMLGFSWPGLVGYMGLSSAGLGVCVNQLVSPDWRPGVPAYFISRSLLEQPSVEACRHVLAKARRGSAPNWLVADSQGDIVDFETTARDHVQLEPQGAVFAHTNHYLHPPFVVQDRLIGEVPDSPARYHRLNDLLSIGGDANDLGVNEFQQYLRDHEGYPASVCRHAEGEAGAIETLVSMVLHLSRRQLYVAAGPPCLAEFTMIPVDP
jgi:isopenicillin-N N-acyltransferase-like protein